MDPAKVRERIREIARNPRHVRFEQIEALLDGPIHALFPGQYSHHGKGSHHAFTVGDQTFNIPRPKNTPFVKSPAVRPRRKCWPLPLVAAVVLR